ncbi:sensor histidine kinase [Paenibacillus sp. MBLB4367]|uniref:sensor histidine kinase n=1 Tax=Paenibacillus sp. MBLB4367 TaxID=3384767 RepID=UPI0039082569
MSYKEIKWLILTIPTLTIGIWEYVRHDLLMSLVSMEVGNMLAPILVFVVTVTLSVKLFSILETTQEELNKERALKAALVERERIARELHDGIAQSLFLLSVKVDQLERSGGSENHAVQIGKLRKTVHQVNEYVRQAIANLRKPPVPDTMPWMESIRSLIAETANDTGMAVDFRWELPEERLSAKEKVELYASLREALLNVRKHAQAERVSAECETMADGGWACTVTDDGRGFLGGDPFAMPDKYGLQILRDRAKEMGWELTLERLEKETKMVIRKKGK